MQIVQENSKSLRSIPNWVLETTSITRLSLRKNNISLVPNDIAQLSHLKRLDLSENQLYSIPAEVGFLTCLEILQLANNHISSLPRTLGKCFNLQILDVKANKITAIPHFFTRLVSLLRLDVSHNALSATKSEFLPAEADGPLDSLWHLTSLVSLTLDGNNIQRLPANIAQLTNIERLALANCGLNALPSHICALVKMKQLFLSDNSFVKLPKLFGNMLLLQELDCDDTLVRDLPATMGRCTNLTRLRMTNCPLNWPLNDLVMQVTRALVVLLTRAAESSPYMKFMYYYFILAFRSLPKLSSFSWSERRLKCMRSLWVKCRHCLCRLLPNQKFSKCTNPLKVYLGSTQTCN